MNHMVLERRPGSDIWNKADGVTPDSIRVVAWEVVPGLWMDTLVLVTYPVHDEPLQV